MKFILASQSQRRQQLLKYLIDDYEIITADINEEALEKLARTPQEMVVSLARAKAKKVWALLHSNKQLELRKGKNIEDTNKSNLLHDRIVVIGADTTVVIPHGESWKSIGKPKDESDAKQTLQMLRGNKHQVYTGICLMVCTGQAYLSSTGLKIISDFDMSTVTFGNFSDEAIDRYIVKGTVLDKAGSYAIQDVGEKFKISVEGSYSNVVGLPIERLVKHFDELGIKYKTNWQNNLQFSKSNFQ